MPLPSFTINLRSLECFRAIIDSGSATAAARELNLTQPAVSRCLSTLEDWVGFELFIRSKGRLIPTDEAMVFYNEVKITLQSVDRISRLALNLHNANFGELRVVSPPSFAEGMLSSAINEFIRKHSDVSITLDSQSVQTALDMVALRAVDCGFAKLPIEHPGLISRPMIAGGTVCAVPKGHKLAKLKQISAHDLDDEPLVLLGKGRSSREQINSAFSSAKARMRVRIETHTVGAACAFAKGGSGIAIVNELFARQFADESIALVRFRPDVRHEYAFITAKEATMSRVTKEFYEHCLRYFKR
jgi:DNA-binding transcriptional LysR family regulator